MPTYPGRIPSENLAARYELVELVSSARLGETLETLVKTAQLAGGIVRNPVRAGAIPNDRRSFPDWRITRVIAYDRDGNQVPGGSHFCRSIRAIEEGDKKCMIADLVHALEAYHHRRAVSYRCEPAQLLDIVAPIVVGGHHLANIYVGQIRCSDGSFETVWDDYQQYLSAKSTDSAEHGVQRDVLQAAYEDLRLEAELPLPLERLKELLTSIAELVSHQAAARAILRLWSELSVELAHTLDVQNALTHLFQRSSHILRFSSGSIVIRQGDKLQSMAFSYPDELSEPMVFPVNSKKGVVPYVFQRNESVICRNRAEIDALCIPNFEASRDIRQLQSLLAVPISVDGETQGVFEIGDTYEHVYDIDDLEVMKSLASFAGFQLQQCSDFATLQGIFQARGKDSILAKFKDEIPGLVHGRGCSIFLRREGVDRNLDRAYLAASSEFDAATEDVFYYFGDGFTGWVLKHGSTLRVDGGEKCRTDNLMSSVRTPYPPPKDLAWKARHFKKDGYDKSYYENRPFLGVPIKNDRGETVGVIRVGDTVSRCVAFGRADENILTTCARLLESALRAEVTDEALSRIDVSLRGLKQDIKANMNEHEALKCELKRSTRLVSRFIFAAGIGLSAMMLMCGVAPSVVWSIWILVLVVSVVGLWQSWRG